MSCPAYRLRLFLSVDLVGSTAFKSGPGKERKDGKLYPVWVTTIRDFYRQFPEHLETAYRDCLKGDGADLLLNLYPKAWKTVGDEILFCCRIVDLNHLSRCIEAFLTSLSKYGQLLKEKQLELDVKGAGWIAAFPGKNVAIDKSDLHNQASNADYSNEETERNADENPIGFDFLGPEIDAGFRVAQKASAERFAVSVELAWLLAKASHLQLFTADYQFTGRSPLKGVIGGRGYPGVLIDTERSASRREVRARERTLLGEALVDPVSLSDFLYSFMQDEGIELPYINKIDGRPLVDGIADSQRHYETAWQSAVKGSKEQNKSLVQSISEDGGGTDPDRPDLAGLYEFWKLLLEKTDPPKSRDEPSE